MSVLTNQSPQRVYVWYTARPQEPIEFVGNAQVKVGNQSREADFRFRDELPNEPGGESYSDYWNPLPILPGTIYRLTVIAANDTIRGSTTVPHPCRILLPAADDTLRIHGRTLAFAIKWTKSHGAFGYVINLIPPRIEYPPGSGLYTPRNYVSYETSDTTYAFSTFASHSGEYVIKIMAYDVNFRRHYFESLGTAGIRGGYGVLASAWVDSVTINVKN